MARLLKLVTGVLQLGKDHIVCPQVDEVLLLDVPICSDDILFRLNRSVRPFYDRAVQVSPYLWGVVDEPYRHTNDTDLN